MPGFPAGACKTCELRLEKDAAVAKEGGRLVVSSRRARRCVPVRHRTRRAAWGRGRVVPALSLRFRPAPADRTRSRRASFRDLLHKIAVACHFRRSGQKVASSCARALDDRPGRHRIRHREAAGDEPAALEPVRPHDLLGDALGRRLALRGIDAVSRFAIPAAQLPLPLPDWPRRLLMTTGNTRLLRRAEEKNVEEWRRLPPVPLPAVALEPEQQVGPAVTTKGYPRSGIAHMLPTVRDPEVKI